ncbi:hypothetical protein [Sphingomonas sp. T9W2]|uniref:hypothetical protein n=1 Tax=Sphingomonas sp. T9W2 TaxID=3143183 RepID=UPI0031F51CEA
MSILDLIAATAIIGVGGLIFWYSDRFSRRIRVVAGLALAAFGWVGIFLAFALCNLPFMQSETVVYGWLGTCVAALLLAMVIGYPAAFDAVSERMGFGRRR